MKHEETSMRTKKELASSLKKFMLKKPLSKITVSEIVRDCGVNRKTFYYHFEDIYALLTWMLEQEAIHVVAGFDLTEDFESAVEFVMDYVGSNEHILSCAVDSLGREELKVFLYDDLTGLTGQAIDGIAEEKGIAVDDDFKKFIGDFFTEGLAGMIVTAVCSKEICSAGSEEAKSRKQIMEFLHVMQHYALPAALEHAPVRKDG